MPMNGRVGHHASAGRMGAEAGHGVDEVGLRRASQRRSERAAAGDHQTVRGSRPLTRRVVAGRSEGVAELPHCHRGVGEGRARRDDVGRVGGGPVLEVGVLRRLVAFPVHVARRVPAHGEGGGLRAVAECTWCGSEVRQSVLVHDTRVLILRVHVQQRRLVVEGRDGS